MKRFFVAFMIAMFTFGAVYAEDRLSLEGSLAVRAWDAQDFWDNEDSASWWEQRLRVGGQLTITDGVTAHFRMDLGEGAWGLDYKPGATAQPGFCPCDEYGHAKLHIDRAYLQIEKKGWALTAGQQYMALGVAQVFDATSTGLVLALDYDPVKVALIYAKIDERGATYDGNEYDDLDAYAVNIAYAGDGFNTNVFYAKAIDGSDLDLTPWALGFNGSTRFGIVDFTGELAFLGGGFGDMDFEGTQLYLTGKAPVTDRVNVGAEFLYAAAADDDKYQLTSLARQNSFSPMSNNTPMSTEFSAVVGDAFDPFGCEGGVIAGTLFADFAINELVTAGCKIGYFQQEDDTYLEDTDALAYNMWIKYQIASNAYLSGTYMVSSIDGDTSWFPEDREVLVGELVVKF